MAKVLVRVQKITGEEIEIHLNPEETVEVVQARVATDMSVPILCQKLWINDPSPVMLKKMVPGIAQQMEKLIETLDKRDCAEVKCFAAPPQLVMKMMAIVYHLMNQKTVTGPMGWNNCKKMMVSIPDFYQKLKEWPDRAQEIPLQEVKAAQKERDEAERDGKWTRISFARVSKMAAVLFDWATSAFRIWDILNTENANAIQLDSFQPLGVYLGDSENDENEIPSLQISLVVDYTDLFNDLSFNGGAEPLEALKVVAPKCRDQSIPALAQCLSVQAPAWMRTKTVEVVQHAFEPDLATAGEFASIFRHLYTDYNTEQAVETLEYLGPSNPIAFKCIITGMNCQSRLRDQYSRGRKVKRVLEKTEVDDDNRAFRDACMMVFKTLEPEADTIQVIDDVLDVILMGPNEKNCCRGEAEIEKEVLDALAIVAAKNYDYVILKILEVFNEDGQWARDDKPSFKTRASQAAAAIAQKEDQRLIEVMTRTAGNPNHDLDLRKLMIMAECFQKISDSQSPFVPTMLTFMEAEYSYTAQAIDMMAKIAQKDDPGVIERMQRYVNDAAELLQDGQGETWISAALNCLESVVSDKSISEKASMKVIDLLIRKCCVSYDRNMTFQWVKKGCKPLRLHEFLMDLAERCGGVKSRQLWNIANGFNSTIENTRGESLRIFKKIPKAPEAKPVPVLFKVLDEDFSSYSCCAAVKALAHTAPPDMPEVTERLLRVVHESRDTLVRTAALEALKMYSTDDSLKKPISKLLDDGDLYVRREAVKISAKREWLAESEYVQLHQLLADSDVDVVLLTLKALNDLGCLCTVELSVKVEQIMREHHDQFIRLEAVKLMLFLNLPVAPVNDVSLWPEMDDAVRQARSTAQAA